VPENKNYFQALRARLSTVLAGKIFGFTINLLIYHTRARVVTEKHQLFCDLNWISEHNLNNIFQDKRVLSVD
jgi:hypothetical protein